MPRTHVTNGLLRTASAAAHLRLFVLAGIVTVLATRAFLAATGYPKLGGGAGTSRLHISHMLWGGLLMLAGLLVMLVFTGVASRQRGALVGGVGFGLFIDEVGKQVADVGYFYRPAAGIIYLTFAALTGLVWWVARRTRTDRERAPGALGSAAAADIALHGVLCGLTPRERQEALRRLRGTGAPAGEVEAALAALIEAVPDAPAPRPGPHHEAVRRARAWLGTRVSGRRELVRIAAWGTTLQAALLLVAVAVDGLTGALAHETEWTSIAGALACSLASLVLALRGTALLGRDQDSALRTLRAALLVDLLLGQAFKFTLNQFSAVTDWLISLALLYVLTAQAACRDTAAPTARRRSGDGPPSRSPKSDRTPTPAAAQPRGGRTPHPTA
ncbi:hypothetical protein [Streptomyces sp. NBC_00083]|uniref:hypothetical protein n=1 Tax=Streptomyces sp. NBC_00083 TaxID=2975647 RepID=UPI002257C59E|nr:hypothetical protein [Streptomyces sp. NBC_00083]MCX5387184.1 hypothetical protein [Streptomyces sp. NBC_00083]